MTGRPVRDPGLRIGCYPGSFNPPTVAHLAVAEAAVAAAELDRVDWVVSRSALGKEGVAVPTLADRLAVLREVAASRPWLGVVLSEHRLVADLAAGYDAVVMGADKWRQVNDAAWYGDDPATRDAAVARLPLVLVAPRADDDLAGLERLEGVRLLPVGEDHRPVSASAIRDGEPGARAWLLPEAAGFDARTHAWSDPARYRSEGAQPSL
ncbi:hypothetical protein KSP35_11585 [Aquihabitans sp. G128]|uniref:hypothetical protein n=1 Tax=Aquihabitans sp. G128 TaxID=2849779 RepID=UPI001C241161|nr:hypothetical protein [Aquihabitans sp. G128]QXC63368.1 hypothetical protein KSP35_11585 [Aquihabitans sp. G128]